jgi:MoaA/NifB/PqqE/SkfB family radical SAM enzyme
LICSGTCRNIAGDYLPVKLQIGDRSLMMILLLEECNFDCPHCVREEEPMYPGYSLTYEQLKSCLADCRFLKSVRWIHFSGGEPTLWHEGKRSLIDLLLEIANAGFTPGFTTNGSFFIRYSKCSELLGKYVDISDLPLRIFLSIDTFHHNFNPRKGRAISLDNVVKFKQTLPQPQAELLDIAVITVISKDTESLLPEGMVEYYESLGVSFGFVPLHLMGKARSFAHLCPDLTSDNPEDLGAYARYHHKAGAKRRGAVKKENRADHINLIGDLYFFAEPWRELGRLGHLPDAIVSAYADQPRAPGK